MTPPPSPEERAALAEDVERKRRSLLLGRLDVATLRNAQLLMERQAADLERRLALLEQQLRHDEESLAILDARAARAAAPPAQGARA